MKLRSFAIPGALAAASVLLTACGGGSSSTANNGSSFDSQAAGARSNQIAGPLDPVQDMVVGDLIGGQLASNLPAPVGPAVSCLADAANSLVDGPDALLAALTELPNGGDPAAALQGAAGDLTGSLQRFAAELQSALAVLAGGESDCATVAGGGDPFSFGGSNPLAGTPLAPLGDALAQLAGGLPGSGSNGDDPELTAVTDTLSSLLGNVIAGFSLLPEDTREAPVVGGLLAAIEDTLVDLDNTLPAVGSYNAPETQDGVETLLNNLLGNVLLGVLPVAQIDEATGQNFSGQIQAGIDQATSALGDGLGQLITPLFDDLLNGALEPVLDPVEGLLAQLLGGGLPGGDTNPLSGLLGTLAGDGSGSPLDAVLGLLTFGSTGKPLADLTQAIGGATGGSPLAQLNNLLGGGSLPLDNLLGQLQSATDGIPLVGDVLDALLGQDGLLGGLLGGLQG